MEHSMGILKGIAYAVASILLLGALISIVGILTLIGMASGAIFLGIGVVAFIFLLLRELLGKKEESSQ